MDHSNDLINNVSFLPLCIFNIPLGERQWWEIRVGVTLEAGGINWVQIIPEYFLFLFPLVYVQVLRDKMNLVWINVRHYRWTLIAYQQIIICKHKFYHLKLFFLSAFDITLFSWKSSQHLARHCKYSFCIINWSKTARFKSGTFENFPTVCLHNSGGIASHYGTSVFHKNVNDCKGGWLTLWKEFLWISVVMLVRNQALANSLNL